MNHQRAIAEILESWSLYRIYRYEGAMAHQWTQDPQNPGAKIMSFYLPSEIILPCPKCEQRLRWQCASHQLDSGFNQAEYTCKNCAESVIHYFVYWHEHTDGKGSFYKAGQYPPLESEPPAELRLESGDLDLYKKALTSRNFSFGIGALAYLRRVVENQMNRLLELVADAAKAAEADEQEWSAGLAEAKESRAFDKKVAFAAKILPAHLKPGGHNPFDVLHGFASGGLHAKSEEECLATFDSVQLVFEYLFNQLTVSSEDTKAYADRLAQLASGKPQKKK